MSGCGHHWDSYSKSCDNKYVHFMHISLNGSTYRKSEMWGKKILEREKEIK